MRGARTGLAAVAAATALLALPAAASAETLRWSDIFWNVSYDASSSFNVNHVAIAQNNDKLVLTDQNTITVSNSANLPQCRSITAMKAECDAVTSGTEPYDILLSLGNGNDVLDAGNTNFTVVASGWYGQDVLHGQGGPDFMIGGPDDDKLYGSGGPDVLSDDQVLGGAPHGYGNDQLYGAGGSDQLSADHDPAAGVPDRDLMDGGPETDTAVYDQRSAPLSLSLNGIADDGQAGEQDNLVNVENVTGGAGVDTIGGSAGNNELRGNSSADTIAGGAGADKLYGGPGDDTLMGGPGGDLYDGGEGRDAVSYADVPGPVTVNFGPVANSGEAGEGDMFASGVEVVTGSAAGDSFTGDANANEFHAGAGSDTVDGGEGPDALDASDGADTVIGGPGDDRIDAGVGVDTVEANAGDDRIALRDGEKDSVTCGTGNDTVEADADDDVFSDCEVVNRSAATPVDMTPDGSDGSGGNSGNNGGGSGGAVLLRAAIGPAKVKVDRRGRGTLLVGCPAAAPSPCSAGVVLATSAKRPLKLASAGFEAQPGATRKVRFRLARKGRARLRKAKRLKASVTVVPRKGAAAPARTKRTVTLVLKRR